MIVLIYVQNQNHLDIILKSTYSYTIKTKIIMEKTTLICVLLVLLVPVFAWSFSWLLKAISNYKAVRKAYKHPEQAPFSTGIVINRETKKLEGDQSPILPF